MRAIEVVEVQEVPEAAIERGTAREVVAPEYHAPVLGEDGLLQTLDKAIGPGVPGFNPRVANTQRHAGRVELGFELTAAIRHHPPQGPPGPSAARDQAHTGQGSDG